MSQSYRTLDLAGLEQRARKADEERELARKAERVIREHVGKQSRDDALLERMHRDPIFAFWKIANRSPWTV